MNLPQFLLLFLNVSFDHACPLLQLILQVLHCIQLRRELHSESIEKYTLWCHGKKTNGGLPDLLDKTLKTKNKKILTRVLG